MVRGKIQKLSKGVVKYKKNIYRAKIHSKTKLILGVFLNRPIEASRKLGRCHPLEAGFWPLWMTPLPRSHITEY
jgi:hypothetical protein